LGPSLARFGGSRSILRIAPSRCRQARSAVAAVSSCSGACIEILVRSVRARSGIPTLDPTVFGLTGDLRLDAFAGRLVSYAARRTKSRLWQASRLISRREIGRIGIQIGRRSSWPSSLCGFGRRKASCVPRAEDSAAAGHRSFTPTCGRSWAQLAPQPSAISGRERERPKAGPSRRLAVLNRENRTPVFGPRPQRDRGQ